MLCLRKKEIANLFIKIISKWFIWKASRAWVSSKVWRVTVPTTFSPYFTGSGPNSTGRTCARYRFRRAARLTRYLGAFSSANARCKLQCSRYVRARPALSLAFLLHCVPRRRTINLNDYWLRQAVLSIIQAQTFEWLFLTGKFILWNIPFVFFFLFLLGIMEFDDNR